MSLGEGALPDGLRLREATPAALGALLGVAPSLAERLGGCQRVAPRLTRLAFQRFGPPPGALTAAQDRVMRMNRDALQRLAMRAGAVWHARRVLQVLDGAALRALASAIGPDARDAALRWRHLAGDAPQEGSGPLGELVWTAGRQCLHGWCDMQPLAVGGRVRLLLPNAPPGGMDSALGAQILEALVSADA